MEECLLSHTRCKKPKSSLNPTTLLDVGTDGSAWVVRLAPKPGNADHYVALSYCWGGPQPMTLTKSTVDELRQGVPLSKFPQTLQDAATSTRKLGLRYLWVDALCILQDDPYYKDLEMAQMSRIYQNASVTICAASAESCHDGFLGKRLEEGPFSPGSRHSRVPFLCSDGSMGSVLLREQKLYYPSVEPLNRRAWALQERALSPRNLTYGSWQLYWRCRSARHCDGGRFEWFAGEIQETDVLGDGLEDIVEDYDGT